MTDTSSLPAAPPSPSPSEAAERAARDAMASPAFRLPPHVRPQHYAIEFEPNTAQSTFAGAVHITLKVVEAPAAPLTHIILHALNLTMDVDAVHVHVPVNAAELDSAELMPHPSHQRMSHTSADDADSEAAAGRRIPCVALHHVSPSETVQLVFASPLPSSVGDRCVLVIERFDGLIATGTDMDGLYHSSRTNSAVISTHLEPTNARRLFPCFDEPAIQATFQLSVITDAALTAISNTEVEADVPLCRPRYGSCSGSGSGSRRTPRTSVVAGSGDGADASASASPRPEELVSAHSFSSTLSTPAPSPCGAAPSLHCVRFQTTPPLHTCIVGFHVGKFNILEQRSRLSRVLCRVVLPHTEPNSSGWFALDLVTKALDFFEEFFDVRLPLKKLDLMAMDKFSVLGMENWGLINLHKDYLIVTGTTPLERRQRITRLIGHETCHQWFGNWISIEWWNCLWLKEGMCRYLEYFFVNAIFPSWGLWNEFVGSIMNSALLADADPHDTHPVQGCNPAPRRIYDSFDTISYGKGACVLRMMFSLIGTEWLRRAAHLLMTRFANRSFNARDLGDCIVETADQRSSKEAQVQHATAIRYALHMVEAVSHPYLYIHHIPGEGYNITQYVAPSHTHGLLVEYVQSQRGKPGVPAIDLFSAPAHISYTWTPEETLRRVPTPFAIPLRSVQWHRGGHGSVRLLFLEEVEQFIPAWSAAGPSSAYPLGSAATASNSSGAAATVAVAVSAPWRLPGSPTQSRSADQSSPTSPTSQLPRVCYFNHGGGGFYQCDYDMDTWRQLFEFAAAFSEEDRLVITLHFINTAKAQLGCQPNTDGDRCTLFFEWLLHLTGTPGAMNAFLWDIITTALTDLVYLAQQYYCEGTVKAFINGLYLPLQKRCVLSFFAQEKTVSFQSSIHLSRSLVLNILQLLCLCENPEVIDEAEETAQWALARVLSAADSPFHPGTAGSSNANSMTANAGPPPQQSVEVASGPLQGSLLRSAAPSPLSAAATLGPPARRSSQADLNGHSGGSNGAPSGSPAAAAAAAVAAMRSSPVKLTPAMGQQVTSGFSASVPRALPAPQLSATPHGDHNLFSSFGGPSSTTDWASVKNNSIASYPYQRAAELNLTDASHLRAGNIALTHLASQGRLEPWMAAAAVAAEILDVSREGLTKLTGGVPVPSVRLAGLDRQGRDTYLQLVLPAVFALDREPLFPFMARIFRSLSMLYHGIVVSLYRNSRFLLHLISHGCLGNRGVLTYILRCGADMCSNGFVIAQLKALAQGGVTTLHGVTGGSSPGSSVEDKARANGNVSISSSVEMFKEVEFADSATRIGGTSPEHSTAPPSPTLSRHASSSASAALSTERSALRLQAPAMANALDKMEANCVWMDYCCWHYDSFMREKHNQQRQRAWQRTRSEANSSMQMSLPTTEELEEPHEFEGGVSI